MAIPDGVRTSGSRWWLIPTLISLLNVAVVLVAVTSLVGWSAPVVIAVIVGFVTGAWWFLNQRPGRS